MSDRVSRPTTRDDGSAPPAEDGHPRCSLRDCWLLQAPAAEPLIEVEAAKVENPHQPELRVNAGAERSNL
jgi:hypothetical protein